MTDLQTGWVECGRRRGEPAVGDGPLELRVVLHERLDARRLLHLVHLQTVHLVLKRKEG